MWDNLKKYLKAVFFQGWFWKDEVKENKTALLIIVGIILLVLVLLFIPIPRGRR